MTLQGHRFICNLKTSTRLPISDQ